MAAAEREAGAAVVEFHVGTIRAILGLSLDWQHDAKPQDQCDENPPHHPPVTQQAMWFVSVHRHANPNRFIRCSTTSALLDCCKCVRGNMIPFTELHAIVKLMGKPSQILYLT